MRLQQTRVTELERPHTPPRSSTSPLPGLTIPPSLLQLHKRPVVPQARTQTRTQVHRQVRPQGRTQARPQGRTQGRTQARTQARPQARRQVRAAAWSLCSWRTPCPPGTRTVRRVSTDWWEGGGRVRLLWSTDRRGETTTSSTSTIQLGQAGWSDLR